ncbi:MAG: DUF1460 domain-containing protein [Bacteroidales bacterium]|nr:DUF1460 domain-containing protein [Bacteroidales bacterium]
MIKRVVISLFAAFLTLSAFAQEDFMSNVRVSAASPAIFEKVAQALEPYKEEPAGELIVRCAKQFLGTEYVAGTLETEPEQLTINMDKTDCILFVEMCLAMVQTVKGDEATFENFCQNTQALRYRGGEVDGYASRNHYTSGWILQGEKNGIFKEVTKYLGGSPLDQKFSFMSTHPDSYKQLADNPGAIVGILKVEKELEGHNYWYLPQSHIADLAKGIKEGDIICFVTPVGGLDIGHVAIACEKNGEMHFIHASTKAMKVVIDSQTISDYILTHKSTNGARVVRLN